MNDVTIPMTCSCLPIVEREILLKGEQDRERTLGSVQEYLNRGTMGGGFPG
jgi:hypothetical protein